MGKARNKNQMKKKESFFHIYTFFTLHLENQKSVKSFEKHFIFLNKN